MQKKGRLPTESLTASSWPFFLVQMYFPLLAFSATRWPSHSTENMAFADLQVAEGRMSVLGNTGVTRPVHAGKQVNRDPFNLI